MIIKILVVCDQSMLSESISFLLQSDSRINIVDKVKTYTEALEIFQNKSPDIALICMDLSFNNNINIINRLAYTCPSLRTVSLVSNVQKNMIIETIGAGAKGFISIFSEPHELFFAINSVFHNKFYICQFSSKELVSLDKNIDQSYGFSKFGLQNREVEVLILIANGKSSKEIAKQLHIAPSTVDAHRRNIMNKIGLHKSTDLTRYAIRNNFIQP
jgi:DNA-binding NarL/FixJ family response regulator